MMDKFRQMKAENDRLKEEMTAFKGRLGNATEDYVRGRRGGWGRRVEGAARVRGIWSEVTIP